MQYLTQLTRYRASSSVSPDLSGVAFTPDGTMLATNVLVRMPLPVPCSSRGPLKYIYDYDYAEISTGRLRCRR